MNMNKFWMASFSKTYDDEWRGLTMKSVIAIAVAT
jgi:hypothetical protein